MLSWVVDFASSRNAPRSMSPLDPGSAPEAGLALPPSARVRLASDLRPVLPMRCCCLRRIYGISGIDQASGLPAGVVSVLSCVSSVFFTIRSTIMPRTAVPNFSSS